MEPKHERKGIPALGEAILPDISPGELLGALLGAVDAAKANAAKETLRRVFIVLDEVTFTSGKIEMTTARLKQLLTEAVK